MSAPDEGLGPDSDDDFEVWMLGSDDVQDPKPRDTPTLAEILPVVDESRSAQEVAASYALAAEDTLSYFQVLKDIRLRMMRERAFARTQFLVTAKQVCFRGTGWFPCRPAIPGLSCVQARVDEQLAKCEASFTLEHVLEGAELRSNTVKA
jgi:hypothetical protein